MFSTICAVNYEGWWLSDCRGSVAELAAQARGVLGLTPGDCRPFHFSLIFSIIINLFPAWGKMLWTSCCVSSLVNWSACAQMQKQSSAIAKWENITQVLQPFSHESSLDPQTLYLVPRPETKELDSVISRVETQLTELEVRRVQVHVWCHDDVFCKGGSH